MEFIFKRLQTILKNWKMYHNLGKNVLITWKNFCLFVSRHTTFVNEHTLKGLKKLSQDSNKKCENLGVQNKTFVEVY